MPSLERLVRISRLFGLAALACLCGISAAQQDSETLTLRPSTDLASRGMGEYSSINSAPLIIRSAPPAGQQNIRLEGPRINVGTGVPGTGEGRGINPYSGQFEPAAALDRTLRDDPADRPRTEFQALVWKTTGKDLNLFGRDLFAQAPSSFNVSDRTAPVADYRLGPEDEVYIRGWGQIDVDFRGTLDRAGNLYVPYIGNIGLAGVKVSELNTRLKAAFARYFRNFTLDAGLSQPRSLQLYVTGHAARPGSYRVNGLATLVNAIFEVGGPGDHGSMRRIQLKRNGVVLTEIDLYAFLVFGDTWKDVRLQSGDILHFMPLQGQAAVMGSVNRPAVFEVLSGTTFDDLIAYAGGLATTAGADRVAVDRIEKGTGRLEPRIRRTDEVVLSEVGKRETVRDGDLVQVFPATPRFEGTVTLRGSVPETRRIPWKANLRVSDLIPDALALASHAFWQARNQRSQSRHWLLDKDPKPDDPRSDAANRTPRNYVERFPERMLLDRPGNSPPNGPGPVSRLARDLAPPVRPDPLVSDIRRTGLEINWSYAVVERLDLKTLKSRLLSFNLANAIHDPASADNLVLAPGDIVSVFSEAEIRSAAGGQSHYVKLEGEVARPGVYEVRYGETLAQLVQRAGGLTAEAYPYGAEFTRESTRQVQQRELDEAVDRLAAALERSSSTRLRESLDGGGSGVNDGGSALLDSQRRLVAKLRGVRASGRMVLDLDSSARSLDALSVRLEDGDRLYVPPVPQHVLVLGAVRRPNALLVTPGKSSDDYLGEAGGMSKDADKGEAFILKANGAVAPLGSGWSRTRIAAGDAIIVPENTDHVTWRRVLRDWTQILYQGGVGIASVRVLSDIVR
jgi:protein involved in polysaccharide export with SLBB domain